jgi:hypothetical protein
MVTPRVAELRAMAAAMDRLAAAVGDNEAMRVVAALVPEFSSPPGLAVSAAAE